MTNKTGHTRLIENVIGVFKCEEETSFYRTAIQNLCLSQVSSTDVIVELGTGNGSAVIAALLAQKDWPTIISYEVCRSAYAQARQNVRAAGLHNNYIIRLGDFFSQGANIYADWLMTDPPYLPAPDNHLTLPSLWGGPFGNSVTKRLISLGYPNYILVLSSYSHPADTLDYIATSGYAVVDWLGANLPFGQYTKETRVWQTINSMRTNGTAFFNESGYRVAALLLNKKREIDASEKVSRFLSGT